jgi:hypothetical protein
LDLHGKVEGCVACAVLGIDVAAIGFDEEVDVLDGTARDAVIGDDATRVRSSQMTGREGNDELRTRDGELMRGWDISISSMAA